MGRAERVFAVCVYCISSDRGAVVCDTVWHAKVAGWPLVVVASVLLLMLLILMVVVMVVMVAVRTAGSFGEGGFE